MRVRPIHVAALIAAAFALAAPSGCRDRDPNIPIALIGTPFGQGGRSVVVTYVLRNPDTVSAAISPEYSTNGGATYKVATSAPGGEPTTNLTASPGGTTHVFLWDALADLGPGRSSGLVFRIVPTAGGRSGTIAYSFVFTIDNTDLFIRVPDLAIARQRSSAAGLPGGGVIVAGGGGLTGATEAFEPATDAVSTRAALDGLRESAAATTVLVAGSPPEPQPIIVAGTGFLGVTLSSVERYDPGEDLWHLTALDTDSRTGHTVTRLLDGRVLVAGGGPANDVVIEDATAGAAVTVTAGAARTGHTATLLPDGRVLVAGGRDGAGNVLDSTLIFSPETLTYSPGPPLSTARAGHAAALSGTEVLVTGGVDGSGNVLASAELAGAGLSAFSPLANAMTAAREGHTATGLTDGTVLIVGGAGPSGTDLASAERFFPLTQSFAATRGSLEVARHGHQATPFGAGRVLISGGGTAALEVYLPQSIIGAQVFDPLASPVAGRVEHQVTALADGRALVTGGTDGVVAGGELVALDSAEIADPTARAGDRTEPLAATLTAARRRHTATLLSDGRVLLAGGIGAGGVTLSALEVFDPAGPTFTALAESLPVALSEHTATRLDDGRVLVAGGRTSAGAPSGAAFLFDPAGTPAVTTLTATLVTPRRRHTATLLPDGRVLLAGGITAAGPTASAEIFDPTAGTFAAAAGDLAIARFDHVAARLDDGTVLVAGGRGGVEGASASATADVRIFDPLGDTFTASAPMLSPRSDFVAIAIPAGRVIFAGGAVERAPPTGPDEDLLSPVTASAEVYTAAGGGSTEPTFDPVLSAARRGLAAAPLGGGTFVLIGGRGEAGVTIAGGEQLVP